MGRCAIPEGQVKGAFARRHRSEAGKPDRLNFRREETALCSEQVLFPDFHEQATLTAFQTVPVKFTPVQRGEYGFQCGMGMLRGKLIVE